MPNFEPLDRLYAKLCELEVPPVPSYAKSKMAPHTNTNTYTMTGNTNAKERKGKKCKGIAR